MRIRLLQEVSCLYKRALFRLEADGGCTIMVELDRLQVRIVEGELNRPDTFQSQLTGMDGIFIPSDSKFLVQHPIYRIRKAHPLLDWQSSQVLKAWPVVDLLSICARLQASGTLSLLLSISYPMVKGVIIPEDKVCPFLEPTQDTVRWFLTYHNSLNLHQANVYRSCWTWRPLARRTPSSPLDDSLPGLEILQADHSWFIQQSTYFCAPCQI